MNQLEPHRSPPSYLRLVFPRPGFFIGDTQISVAVNGYPVLQTSFTQGFDWWTEMQPGLHVVETSIAAPIGIARKKTYQLEVRIALVTIAVLEYSRMWGNLTDRPKSVTFTTR